MLCYEQAQLVAAFWSALRSTSVVLAVHSSGRATVSSVDSDAAAESTRAARLCTLLERLPLEHCCALLEQLIARASQPISESCCLTRASSSAPTPHTSAAPVAAPFAASSGSAQQLSIIYTSLHSKLSHLPGDTPHLFLWLQSLVRALNTLDFRPTLGHFTCFPLLFTINWGCLLS